MANTTNFGWETPDDTDLVKDGAAAIRTLGSAIDTSLVDLKGGTTGQILSKTSNTDMDFTWITNDVGDITAVTAGTGITGGGTTGAVTITNDMATTITAAGDIVIGTGNATYDNLPIGTTGQVLTADTTVSPYKVKWASAGAGANWSLLNAGGTNLTGANTVTVSGISGQDKLMIILRNASGTSAGDWVQLRFNSDSAGNYYSFGNKILVSSSYGVGNFTGYDSFGNDTIIIGTMANAAASSVDAYLLVTGCNSSGVKVFSGAGGGNESTSNSQELYNIGGYWNNSATVSSVSVKVSTGAATLDGGTVYIYGSA